MNDHYGIYQGISVYKTDTTSYVNNKSYEDTNNMYLIGNDLIYKNEIYGYFNGETVKEIDPHKRTKFYTKTTQPVKRKAKRTEPTYSFEEHVETPVCEAKTAEDILAGVYTWSVG